MGPSQACGAMDMFEMFAIAATFQSAEMPPT